MTNHVGKAGPFGAAFLEPETTEAILGGFGISVRPNVTPGDYVQFTFDDHSVASMGTYQAYTPFGGLQVDWSTH